MTADDKLRAAHLSDADFSRLLDGAEPGGLAGAHLGACAVCREELQAVQSSLASFRSLSSAWAAVEAPRRIPAPARWLRGLRLQTSWGAGLAATAITGMLAFWLGVPGQPGGLSRGKPAVRAAAAMPTNAELAADNDLLLSIDQALTDPGSPEVSAERLQVTPPHDEPRPAGAITD